MVCSTVGRHTDASFQRQAWLSGIKFDNLLLDLWDEARYWDMLEMKIPSYVLEVFIDHEEYKMLLEHVLLVVNRYNSILEVLSDDERLVFRELFRKLDLKITPGIQRLMWISEYADLYIDDCYIHTKELAKIVEDFKNSNREMYKICKKICFCLMVNPLVGGPYLLRPIQFKMDTYRHNGMVDIIDFYFDLLDYLVVIYYGFEVHLLEMPEEWKTYILKIDRLLEEAIRICIRDSLEILLNRLHGVPSELPISLIEIYLTLVNHKLVFDPSLPKATTWLGEFMNDMVDALRPVPRLYQKFRVKGVENVPPFWQVIQDCEECFKFQIAIQHELSAVAHAAQVYLDDWEPFSDIWETSKTTYMSEYEKQHPRLSILTFYTDITRYENVAEQMKFKPNRVQISFIEVNNTEMKAFVVEHCIEWQERLAVLLGKITHNILNELRDFISDNSELVMNEPQSLEELMTAIELYDFLVDEVITKEIGFPIMFEQVSWLPKYKIVLDPDLVTFLDNLDEIWLQFKKTLSNADKMLTFSRTKFQDLLYELVENLNSETESVMADFDKKGPFTSGWSTEKALEYLENMQNYVDQLRLREQKLQDDLGLFNMTCTESKELYSLDRKLSALVMVWDLTRKWGIAYDSYKYGKFWTIETEKMEETAHALFRKLTRLSRELADRKWEIIQHSLDSVDAFRRTLPLISDLKNSAMRDRHWANIKDIMNM